ncbi:hypothetical protein HHK36_017045 [Tetracentron sinense]|uniref:MADS-box domain-containing protein n=1 Tax=Tetracentron sinense TaxID=13715 RepID=A0A834Z0M5_TETSI|nr:hypothetical protein HHK36_017045 [Tetracentron sinense]
MMGKRKIQIEKIENLEKRNITFSKRRKGLFKKAAHACLHFGSEIAIVAFSPSGNPFSFGHSSVDSVIDRYLNFHSSSSSNSNPSPKPNPNQEEGQEKQRFWWEGIDLERCDDLESLELLKNRLEGLREKASRALSAKNNGTLHAAASTMGSPVIVPDDDAYFVDDPQMIQTSGEVLLDSTGVSSSSPVIVSDFADDPQIFQTSGDELFYSTGVSSSSPVIVSDPQIFQTIGEEVFYSTVGSGVSVSSPVIISDDDDVDAYFVDDPQIIRTNEEELFYSIGVSSSSPVIISDEDGYFVDGSQMIQTSGDELPSGSGVVALSQVNDVVDDYLVDEAQAYANEFYASNYHVDRAEANGHELWMEDCLLDEAEVDWMEDYLVDEAEVNGNELWVAEAEAEAEAEANVNELWVEDYLVDEAEVNLADLQSFDFAF